MPGRKCDYAFGDQGGPLCIMLLYAVVSLLTTVFEQSACTCCITQAAGGRCLSSPQVFQFFVGFRASFLKDFQCLSWHLSVATLFICFSLSIDQHTHVGLLTLIPFIHCPSQSNSLCKPIWTLIVFSYFFCNPQWMSHPVLASNWLFRITPKPKDWESWIVNCALTYMGIRELTFLEHQIQYASKRYSNWFCVNSIYLTYKVDSQ